MPGENVMPSILDLFGDHETQSERIERERLEEVFQEKLDELNRRYEELRQKEIEELLWEILEKGYHISITMSPNSGCHILYHKKDKDECDVRVVDVPRRSQNGEYGFEPIKGMLNEVNRKTTL